MKIGLLECDHVRENLLHIAGDYRQMFADLFARHAPQLELANFDVRNGEFPTSIDDCEAFVCTGSRFSAYDAEDWIQQLKGFVRRLRDAEKPFVGICFGHQVLAEALGGKVEKAAQGWGIGVHSLNVVNHEDWMQPAQSACGIQYSHRDQVTRLPENSLVLGESDHCPVAMFRVGETMLGIQGHPEFPADYVEALVRGRTELIGAELVNAARFHTPTDEAVITAWLAKFLNA
ncbi:MAG TPA: gamma-glutamyl-gamma-aminobutyrate hydrolase family protein [Blastocatellia bacterium]|nr:gamma-glutamyl-gamma-aminobutyrate hydrolase family protein [Blastocatellia bacterium]HMZ21754.1 gamma-glutamyl-gamma-aminobutyrate hydrolase family protein [Blastocatellia bacterium]HNG34023.1 gamma-glutamyl-gamma-aminobutyrate hydrolase family protein [Blastocatellia bacterium]